MSTVKKVPLPVGPYSMFRLRLKPRKPSPFADDFTVKNPELDPFTDDNRSGIPEEEIVLTGKFFGSKKGKVYLEYTDSNGQTKKKNCKVYLLEHDIRQPEKASVEFVVPKLSKSFTIGLHPLRVDNKIGVATASEDFIVGLP